MLKLIDYIINNENWEEDLKGPPFHITIKRKGDLIMFNYSQILSDFHNPIVRECRGIILEDATFTPVCVPFYKFGNCGESHADTIDWKTASVQEKIDGSLIKLWWYHRGGWRISTNGMIDAKDAKLPENVTQYKDFHGLFLAAMRNTGLDLCKLDTSNTYMFELVSPINKVVIYYSDVDIKHIGTRNNITLEEMDIDIGINKPTRYMFKSLDSCIKAAKELPFNEEGYVVVDANWHRVKVKSPAYVAVHHLLNGALTNESIVNLIRKNEHEEFLSYYPEYIKAVRDIEMAISAFIVDMEVTIHVATKTMFNSRKEFANCAKTTICPPIMFNWYDKKLTSVKDWIWAQSNEKIVKWVLSTITIVSDYRDGGQNK